MKYFIFQALYVSIWVVIAASVSQDMTPKEFMERVFGLPKPEDHEPADQELMMDKELERCTADCADDLEVLPEYTETVRSSHERQSRQLETQKHYPICHQERKIRRLNTDEYEYRPAYYEEVKCLSSARIQDVGETNEICSSLGFSCVQWNKTIHLTRRRYTSECWETMKMVILAGCECMWPSHRLGDMKHHI